MPSVLAMASSQVMLPSKFFSSTDCAKEIERCGATDAVFLSSRLQGSTVCHTTEPVMLTRRRTAQALSETTVTRLLRAQHSRSAIYLSLRLRLTSVV